MNLANAAIYIERADHRRYVTLSFFVHEMMGRKNRSWYYNLLAKRVPGLPQRYYHAGSQRPVLDYAECLAFQESATTTPPWKPRRAHGG